MDSQYPQRIPESPVRPGPTLAGSTTTTIPPPVLSDLTTYTAGGTSLGQASTSDSPEPPTQNFSRPMMSLKPRGARRAKIKAPTTLPPTYNSFQVERSPPTMEPISRNAPMNSAFDADPTSQARFDAGQSEVDTTTSILGAPMTQPDFLSKMGKVNNKFGIAGPSLTIATFVSSQRPQLGQPGSSLQPAHSSMESSEINEVEALVPSNTVGGLFGRLPSRSAFLPDASSIFVLPQSSTANLLNTTDSLPKAPQQSVGLTFDPTPDFSFASTGNRNVGDIFQSSPAAHDARLGASTRASSHISSSNFSSWFESSATNTTFGGKTSSMGVPSSAIDAQETMNTNQPTDISAAVYFDISTNINHTSANDIDMDQAGDPNVSLATSPVSALIEPQNSAGILEPKEARLIRALALEKAQADANSAMDGVSTNLYAGQQTSPSPPQGSDGQQDEEMDVNHNEGQQASPITLTGNDLVEDRDMDPEFEDVKIPSKADHNNRLSSPTIEAQDTSMTANQDDIPQMDEGMQNGEAFGAGVENTEAVMETETVEGEETSTQTEQTQSTTDSAAAEFLESQIPVDLMEHMPTVPVTTIEEEKPVVESIPAVYEEPVVEENVPIVEYVEEASTLDTGSEEDVVSGIIANNGKQSSIIDPVDRYFSNAEDGKPSPPVEASMISPIAECQMQDSGAPLPSAAESTKPIIGNDYSAPFGVPREKISENTHSITASEKQVCTSKDAPTQTEPDPAEWFLDDLITRITKAHKSTKLFGSKGPEDYIERSADILKFRRDRIVDDRKAHAEEIARREAVELRLKTENEDLQKQLSDMGLKLKYRESRMRAAEESASEAIESVSSLKERLEAAERKVEGLKDEIAKQSKPLLDAIAEKRRKWKNEKSGLNEKIGQLGKDHFEQLEELKSAHSNEIEELKAGHVREKNTLLGKYKSEYLALERSKKRLYHQVCELEFTVIGLEDKAVAAERDASSLKGRMEWEAGVAERNAGLSRVPGSVSGYQLVQTGHPRPSLALSVVYHKKRGIRWLSAKPRRAQRPRPRRIEAVEDKHEPAHIQVQVQSSTPTVPGSQLSWKTICTIFPLCFLLILFAFQPLTKPSTSILLKLGENQTAIVPSLSPLLTDTCPSWPPALPEAHEQVCTDAQTPPSHMWRRNDPKAYHDADFDSFQHPLTRRQGWMNALPGIVLGLSVGGAAYAKRWI